MKKVYDDLIIINLCLFETPFFNSTWMLGLDFAVDKLTRVSWQQKRSHFKLLSPIA